MKSLNLYNFIKEGNQVMQMNKFGSRMSYVVDSLIYLFIGPFSVLYIIPIFFRGIESSLGIKLQQFYALDIIGTVLMWVGLIIAIWCSTLIAHQSIGFGCTFF